VAPVTELIGVSGSLRQGSFNTALLRAAAALMPEGSRLTIKAIDQVPLYNADREKAEGVPEAVEALKDAIAASDGLLLATPEYNNSIPGVLKNTIDWLSRPPSDIRRVFHDRPVALIGASAGGFGTVLSQSAWLPVLRTLRADFWSQGRLLVSRAGNVVDEEGEVADDEIREQLRDFVHAFAKYARERREDSGG
jgi:chromate reductase, NAD(P)H dehydrogenase (quinone)